MNVVKESLEAQRTNWFSWYPLAFAFGCAQFFGQSWNPDPVLLVAGSIAVIAAGLHFALRGRGLLAGVFVALVAGYLVSAGRVALQHTTVLSSDVRFAELSGWLERVEILADGHRRLLVHVSDHDRPDMQRMPERVVISDRIGGGVLQAGDHVSFRARLFAPSGPVAPGAYDFARRNWLAGVGARGIALSAVSVAATEIERPALLSLAAAITRVRFAIADHLRHTIGGTPGAVIAALVTGDRSGIPQEVTDALRDAGLAHLLAISGLHMSLVAGTIFQVARHLGVFLPLAPTGLVARRLAALLSLIGAALYLGLSGASVSTQRAFVMIAVFTVSVMLDRPAITMRNLAIAAWAVLVMRPEAAIEAGFQMSFLTVAALIAFYERFRPTRRNRGQGVVVILAHRSVMSVVFVMLTTCIASLASAPIAAFHFHRLSTFGLVSNLAAVPMTGFVLMPSALFGMLLYPIGLEHYPLKLAGVTANAIVDIAMAVSAWPEAASAVRAPGTGATAAIVFGFFWMFLWHDRMRWWGLAAVLAPLTVLPGSVAPEIYIDDRGRNIAIRGNDGRLSLMTARRAKYAAEQWLIRDGDSSSLADAAQRGGFTCDPLGCAARTRSGHELVYVTNPALLEEECGREIVLVTPLYIDRPRCRGPTVLVDGKRLRRLGAHAISTRGGTLTVSTARSVHGPRPWTVWLPDRSRDGSTARRRRQ